MSEQQTVSPRRRLQELLDIPERLRTDEQWDELNELEISLNPINRVSAPDPNGRPGQLPGAKARPPGAGTGAGKRKKPHKKLFRSAPKEGKT